MTALDATSAQRCHHYRDLLFPPRAPGMVDQIRQTTHNGLVLGSERFQQQVADLLGRRIAQASPAANPGATRINGDPGRFRPKNFIKFLLETFCNNKLSFGCLLDRREQP